MNDQYWKNVAREQGEVIRRLRIDSRSSETDAKVWRSICLVLGVFIFVAGLLT
ncbi:hypothetical protein D3C85_1881470 [compost metagenome]